MNVTCCYQCTDLNFREHESDSDEVTEDPKLDSLAAAINYQVLHISLNIYDKLFKDWKHFFHFHWEITCNWSHVNFVKWSGSQLHFISQWKQKSVLLSLYLCLAIKIPLRSFIVTFISFIHCVKTYHHMLHCNILMRCVYISFPMFICQCKYLKLKCVIIVRKIVSSPQTHKLSTITLKMKINSVHYLVFIKFEDDACINV